MYCGYQNTSATDILNYKLQKMSEMTKHEIWYSNPQNPLLTLDKSIRKLKPPTGLMKFIKCHMIFDIKMNIIRKASFWHHMTDPPKFLIYTSVVSRDGVRLGFFLLA